MGKHTVIGLLAAMLSVLAISQALVRPTQHTYPSPGLQSVNGSDPNGECTDATTFNGVGLCRLGNSSLVDGSIPTLPPTLVGVSNWAAELFTVNRTGGTSIEIGFELEVSTLMQVELDLFNCPEWGIAAPNITVYTWVVFPGILPSPRRLATRLGGVTTLSSTSCDSITTVLIPFQRIENARFYYLEFTFGGAPSVQWVHLAEVRFTPSPTSITSSMSEPTGITSTTPSSGTSTATIPTSTDTSGETPTNTTTSTDMGEGQQPLSTAIISVLAVVIVILALLVLISILVIVCIIARNKKEQHKSEVEKVKIAMMECGTADCNLKEGKDLNDTNNYESMETKHKKDVISHELHPAYSEIPEAYSEIHEDHDQGLYSEVRGEGNARPKINPSIANDSADPSYPSTLEKPIIHLYSQVQKSSPPTLPRKSSALLEYFDLKGNEEGSPVREGHLSASTLLPSQYSKIEPEEVIYHSQADGDSSSSNPKLPGIVALSVPLCSTMLSNPDYETADDALHTSDLQSEDIYSEPDTPSLRKTATSSNSVSEVVYSEPISPSLFTDSIFHTNVPEGTVSEMLHPYAPIYSVPPHIKASDEPLKVKSSNIQEIHALGVGLFGEVVLAETVGLSLKDLRLSELDDDKTMSTLVAVKKLKPDAPKVTKDAFEKEVKFMSRLNDKNVIRMLGVCYEDTPFIMMEYMEKGDLNHFLKKFDVVVPTGDPQAEGEITTSILLDMTAQIASAMLYLALHNFVHRDLATRNCLVGKNYLVKIADFGMSRNMYESQYYLVQGHAVLPIRWMATECFYGKFSQKSDVWAFGITMWEIFTLAQEQPYSSMKDPEFVNDAIKGEGRKKLKKPEACPPEVYEIMIKCWEHDPSKRSTFEELFKMLSSLTKSS